MPLTAIWTPSQAKLVEVVFGAWADYWVWPNFQYVRGKLRQLGVPDAAAVLRSFPVLGEISPTTRYYCDVWFERTAFGPSDDSKISVSVGGLSNLRAGEDYALAYVGVLAYCADAYDDAPLHPDQIVEVSVSADQVAAARPGFPIDVLGRVGSLIEREHPVGVWSITPGGQDLPWKVGIRSDVERYRNLTVESYLDLVRKDVEPPLSVLQALEDVPVAIGSARPVSFTTEASVTANRIEVEIHEDIYRHIGRYLETGDHFHAVEESYKLVREKLRDLTGKEKASDAFNNSAQNNAHYKALFGKEKPTNEVEADFFRGVGYLHLGVQHLRNEKAHTPATPIDSNLAIHYISLASLAYDLITRYVGEDTIKEIEDFVVKKRRSYRSAAAFYADFENGRWLDGISLPVSLDSTSIRNVLKGKWLEDVDFTQSWDHSNIVLMRLELVAADLTPTDIDKLLDKPTQDTFGNDQEAGLLPFLEYIGRQFPDKLSAKAQSWIEANNPTG